MTFPNAFQGVKKIFTAEILNLIGSVCLIIGFILMIVLVGAADTDNAGVGITSGIGFILFSAASGVLAIIAMILKLVGLKRAGEDEARFQTGFVLAIFALILTIVSSFVTSLTGSNGIWDDLVRTIATLFELLVTMYIVTGIQSLAQKLEREDMVQKGRTYLILFLILYIIRMIVTVIPVFFGSNETMSQVASILSLIAAVFSLIIYILYLVLLGKAKKMLATQ